MDPTYGQTPPSGYPSQQPYGQPQYGQPQYGQPQYGQPQHPQQPPPQQYPPQQPYPQYPQQPPPPQQYPQQPYSAVPYASQPYSAPPVQSGPPMQPGPPMLPAPPEGPRRNRWVAGLVAGSVVVVIAVVVIVVIGLRSSGDKGKTPQTAPPQTGPVDSCLVGRWKQTTYQKIVDFTGTDVDNREKIGKVKMTGGGKIWEIQADGSAIEDDSKTVYTGKTDDGRTVNATWQGRSEYKVSTKDGTITYAGGEATTTVVVNIDGAEKGRIQLEPNLDPQQYTCNGDIWRLSNKDDPSALSRYDREK
ncbi:lipocalin family protein [Dactylosporangium sp. NPDC051485]|uniref:lipocalin family protein n=1 Tax=Dactylosporangium sp. NPDC051485 TaxID=3154846 RepID=UPI00343F554D